MGQIRECDVLVVGSGAGGLATAVAAAHRRLDVLVVEKEPLYGGTSARSGGTMWIPGNALARRAGLADSREQAETYLRHELGEHHDPRRVDAFLDFGPETVDFFEQNTELKFYLAPSFADYHSAAPGGVAGGRSIVAEPYDGRALGAEMQRLRPPLADLTAFGMMISAGEEVRHFLNASKSPASALVVAKLFVKHLRDLIFHGRPMRLTNGNALIGRLAKACFDKNVPIWTNSPARKLITDASGRVAGALVDTPLGPCEIRARKGVVLAAGGFPQDVARRKTLYPHAPSGHEHESLAPPGNTGDGVRMAEAIGAAIDESLPNAAAWVPISRPLRANGTLGVFPHFIDRAKPGIIAITRSGRRFVNEACSYHDFCQAMRQRCAQEGGEVCAFLIADHLALRRYGLGLVKPAPVPHDALIKSGYLLRAGSLSELAHAIGADPAQCETTVREFNRHAVRGEDPEFLKGSTAYNHSQGDPDHKPNPCVAPLETGPFYAVKVVIGDIGTFAGVKCDAYGRALSEIGAPIPGLYCVGNDAASLMGGNYPGAGITLGPALVFGYIAARHLSGANA